MYKLVTKTMVRRTFKKLSAGDIDAPLSAFADDVHFHFAGHTALSCNVRGKDEARRWFERAVRLFPGIQFEVCDVVVNGMPWQATVMTRLAVSATLQDGSPYRNEAMQLIRMKWGRIHEDLVVEDTQRLARALERLSRHGIEEAASV